MDPTPHGPIGVGIIGCGNVFPAYMKGLAQYDEVRVVHCSDILSERAAAGAAKYGIPRWSGSDGNEGLLTDDEVEVVINITPVLAHVEVSRSVLLAGKHLYTEKTMSIDPADARALLKLANEKGVLFGSAADTFLGTWGTTAKHLVDTGAVGSLVAASACFAGNRVETRHPDPRAFYQRGGGPLLESGPYVISALVHLLGPVAQVVGRTRVGAPIRYCLAPDRVEDEVPVAIPTHATAVLTFASGVIATAIITFDIWSTELPLRIELYGIDGTISVPHPNWYDGDVKLAPRPKGWENDWSVVPPMGTAPQAKPRELIRGPGVIDLVGALRGEAHRTSAGFALHVLDVLVAIQDASDTERAVTLAPPGQ